MAGPNFMRPSPIFQTPQAQPGILGFSPQQVQDKRRKNQVQSIGDAIAALGIGLMGRGPSTTPQGPMDGLALGLSGANQSLAQSRSNQMDQDRMDMVQEQHGMQRQQFEHQMAKDEREEMLRQARDAEMERLLVGLPQDMQQAAKADPDSFWKAYAESKFPKEKDPWQPKMQTIRRGSQDESGYFDQNNQWVPMSSGAAFAPRNENQEFGLQPFITKDADGTLHAWQLSKSGPPKEIPLPDGQSVTQQISMFDNGMAGVPVGKLTGPQPAGVPSIPKDPAGEASAKEQGKLQGAAAAALPTYAAKAGTARQNISDLLSDENKEGREWATGKSSIFGALVPGTAGYDYKVRVKQLAGSVFLQAFQDLKGGGAITEIEGKKAEQAIARLDTAQSEEEFVGALQELDGLLQKGLSVAEQKAVAAPIMPGDAPPSNKVLNFDAQGNLIP